MHDSASVQVQVHGPIHNSKRRIRVSHKRVPPHRNLHLQWVTCLTCLGGSASSVTTEAAIATVPGVLAPQPIFLSNERRKAAAKRFLIANGSRKTTMRPFRNTVRHRTRG